MTGKEKHPVDVLVGGHIRQRRWELGVTQQQLAQMVGIKFQQIQKYETGMNRVSASRLWDISKALKVDISYFFNNAEQADRAETLGQNDKEAATLVRYYRQIPEKQRRKLFEMAQTLSSE